MGEFHDKVLKKIGTQAKMGGGCLICGRIEVTREDVFPKWLQRKFDLALNEFSRPNGTTVAYSKVIVPLCAPCNNEHFSQLENSISQKVSKGLSAEDEASPDLHLWLTKIYYFLQIFENGKPVYEVNQGLIASVTDEGIFDAHLLQIMLKKVANYSDLTFREGTFASVWIVDCDESWPSEEFMFGSLPGRHVIALKLGKNCIFAVLGDWGEYKRGAALEVLKTPIDYHGFLVALALLDYFVSKNRISTSFGFRGSENGDDPEVFPLAINASEMDFEVGDDFEGFFDNFLSKQGRFSNYKN